MTWDFGESNPLGNASGNYVGAVDLVAKALSASPCEGVGAAHQGDARAGLLGSNEVVSTDPPYYDNIGYADLSDFFYIWLRRSLKPLFPELFATLAVPKAEELVATPYRHGSKDAAEAFFLRGMTRALHRLAVHAHPGFPVTIYYAFKQSERKGDSGVTSTGWETFLHAVIRSGFAITGTWPMRTELINRMIGRGANALASSIVLVCRRRPADAAAATRREFLTALSPLGTPGAPPPPVRQRRPGRPRPSGDWSRHGGIHALRAVGAMCASCGAALRRLCLPGCRVRSKFLDCTFGGNMA